MARPGSEQRNGLGANSEFAGREDKAAIRKALGRSPEQMRESSTLGGATANQAQAEGFASGGSFCLKCGAWLGCLGLEPTPALFVEHIVEVFREVRRVLHPSGTVFCNLGDSYAGTGYGTGTGHFSQRDNPNANTPGPKRGEGLKAKDLVGVPWMVAFALRADGWWLRSDIIWAKGASFNAKWSGSVMPESCRDRPTSAHEHLFLLAKSRKYFYDAEAVREAASGGAHPQGRGTGQKHEQPGRGVRNNTSFTAAIHNPTAASLPSSRNLRNVWAIGTAAYAEAHFATYPPALVEPCVKAGASERGCCPKCYSPWQRVVERDVSACEWEWSDVRDVQNPAAVAKYLTTARKRKGMTRAQVDQALGTRTLYSWFEGRPAGIETPTVEQWRALKSILDLDDTHDEDVARTRRVKVTNRKPQRAPLVAPSENQVQPQRRTVGWRPTCECETQVDAVWADGTTRPVIEPKPYPPVPAIVLDPFFGSGTSGIVARRLGRDYIGCEASAEYAAMARQRLADDDPSAAVESLPPDAPLFAKENADG